MGKREDRLRKALKSQGIEASDEDVAEGIRQGREVEDHLNRAGSQMQSIGCLLTIGGLLALILFALL